MLKKNLLATMGGAQAPDPDFEYVTMLLHGDGTNGAQNNTFLDSSSTGALITRTGNTTQGTFSPYGANWSNYFDGSGDYLQVSSTPFDFSGGADFTLEFFMYVPDGVSYGFIYQNYSTSPGITGQAINAGSTFVGFENWNGGDQSPTFSISGTTIAGQWNHVALVRSGSGTNNISLFINGSRAAQGTLTSFTAPAQGSTNIGARNYLGYKNYLTGYISNLRIVKGTGAALYSGTTYVVPTTPLTAVTNTVLLTCQANRFLDASSNNYSVTRTGDVSVQRFSPFSPTTAYSTSVIGGSGYFDGTGDYLTAAGNAFSPGTQNFYTECWIYPTGSGPICSLALTSYEGYRLWISGSSLYWSPSQYPASSITSANGCITPNAWNYVVANRNGNRSQLWVNGIQYTNEGTISIYNFYMSTMYIGTDATGSTFPGYISDFRTNIGVTYPGGVPTSPLTANSNAKLLLNFTNAGILDNAMMNDLETVGNSQVSTSVKKYGTGSMYFDGSGDYLSAVTNPMYQFGSSNFTIEFWFYQNSRTAGEYDAVFRLNGAGTGFGADMYMTIGAGASGYALAVSNNARNGWAVLLNPSGGLPSLSAWHHMAIVRNGSTWTVYLDGLSVGTATYSGTVNTPTGAFQIGWAGTADSYWDGYIDDLRITKGVARYTANFTPPAQAFPNN